MSELKTYRFLGHDEIWADSPNGSIYYLKDEADKVIADLEIKLATAQQVLRLNKPEALYSNLDTMGRLNNEKDVVAREFAEQKAKADKLHSCLKCLVMRDLIKDCPEKRSAIDLMAKLKKCASTAKHQTRR